MESPLGEDTPSYSMVKKWAGEFKRGREGLEDYPRQGRLQCSILSIFPFSRSRGLQSANWLCLIISNRKTRNGSISSNLQYIHQLSRSAHAKLQLYRTSASTLGHELTERPLYTVDFLICMFADECHSWTGMLLCYLK